MSDSIRARKIAEIDKNYAAFRAKIDDYMAGHAGEFALMKDGEVVQFCASWEEASKTGRNSFADELYSIQKVTKTPDDMGWDSRVVRVDYCQGIKYAI